VTPTSARSYASPKPGRLWAIRRKVAARLRMLGNWVDQGDGLWIDDFFTEKQRERYEDVRSRLNGLHAALEEALKMQMADPQSEQLVEMTDRSSSGDPVRAKPFSVLQVLIREALADFPAVPDPEPVDLSTIDERIERVRRRAGVID